MTYDRDFIPGVGGRRSGGDRFLRRRVLKSSAKLEIKEAFADQLVVIATLKRAVSLDVWGGGGGRAVRARGFSFSFVVAGGGRKGRDRRANELRRRGGGDGNG